MQSITRLMTRDHNRILTLFSEFKREKKRDVFSARGLFNRFRSDLYKHFDIEERLLSNISSIPGTEKALILGSMMAKEHIMIKNTIETVAAEINQNKTIIDISNLYRILTSHAQTEDEYLYPELDASLTTEQKRKLHDIIRN